MKKNYFFLPFAFNPSIVICTGNVHWTNACTGFNDGFNEKSILHVAHALEANQWMASEGHAQTDCGFKLCPDDCSNHGTCDGNGTIRQPNKHGSTCATGSTSLSILSMGVVTAFMATMAFWALDYKVCHIYNDCDTSHNHTMFAPYQLVVGGGGPAMQAKSTGSICLTSAITAAYLTILMSLIDLLFGIGSRYVCL